jgi:TonB family protein
MSAAVQRAILCHEFLHVKRRDWLQTLGEEVWRALLWFHPHAHVIASQLSLAREMVVDEQTILITRDRRAYAEALLAFSNPQPHVIASRPSSAAARSAGAFRSSQRRVPCHTVAPLPVPPSLFPHASRSGAAAVNRFRCSRRSTPRSVVYKPETGGHPAGGRKGGQAQYTRQAMEAKIQGSVWMECVVTENGDISDVEITRSLHQEYGLDQAAIDAARQWKFKPGLKDGKPVAVRITIELTFKLKK